MKHIQTKDRSHVPGTNCVRFKFHDSTAKTVCIAGSFNNWQPEAGVGGGPDDGRWTFEKVLPYGDNEYRFVVDGWWVVDPSAAEHNAAAERSPLKNAHKRKHYRQN